MIVYFIRGIAGAGKTTLAEGLQHHICHDYEYIGKEDWYDKVCPILEADKWMTNERGEYEFDYRKLPMAHAACLAEYEKALREHVPYVVVSNTSKTEAEVEPYHELAIQNGYEFVSLIVENRHGNKSVHNIPDERLEKMKTKFSIKL